MAQPVSFDEGYARRQLSRKRSLWRRVIKSFYVSRILRHIDGPAIDLGCGGGQLLARLPPGSIGIEVNPHLVRDLTQSGLSVRLVDEGQAGFGLRDLPRNVFSGLVLSHVLEHFDAAALVLREILELCANLGIATVVVVVPGASGFRSDPTHRTFVSLDYLKANELLECAGFRLAHESYFPGNYRFLGDLCVYHELLVVYRKVGV